MTHFCVMCEFETQDESAAYEHDCMKPSVPSTSEEKP